MTASEATLQAYRSSFKSLELVMDGYVVLVEQVDTLMQMMLASLQSIGLLLLGQAYREVWRAHRDACSTYRSANSI